jgi:putative peptidoglycan lipid II flippase
MIAAAAGLHLTLVTLVFAVARFGLLPSQFDDNGIGEFAFDGHRYRTEAVALADLLNRKGLAQWFAAPPELHVKLYSLPFALLGPRAGFNVLSAEPLNILYYLAAVCLVFALAEVAFGRRAGLLAAATVALWPSFLMHTTQLLRDPLLIVAFLALALIVARWLAKVDSWRRGLLAGLAAALALLTIFVVRQAIWDVARAVVGLGTVLLVVRQLRERRFLRGNVLSAALLVAAAAIIPQGKAVFDVAPQTGGDGKPLIAEQVFEEPLWARIAERRRGFVNPLGGQADVAPASNIDVDVQFNGWADMIRYLPRAAVIGFFSPFPDMWLAQGSQVGATGRRLSGLEMLFTYLIELLALAGLWYRRRELTVWLLALTAAVGATALGLIVLNIGSLYRVRYPFWMLLVVLGAGGVTQLRHRERRDPAST